MLYLIDFRRLQILIYMKTNYHVASVSVKAAGFCVGPRTSLTQRRCKAGPLEGHPSCYPRENAWSVGLEYMKK